MKNRFGQKLFIAVVVFFHFAIVNTCQITINSALNIRAILMDRNGTFYGTNDGFKVDFGQSVSKNLDQPIYRIFLRRNSPSFKNAPWHEYSYDQNVTKVTINGSRFKSNLVLIDEQYLENGKSKTRKSCLLPNEQALTEANRLNCSPMPISPAPTKTLTPTVEKVPGISELHVPTLPPTPVRAPEPPLQKAPVYSETAEEIIVPEPKIERFPSPEIEPQVPVSLKPKLLRKELAEEITIPEITQPKLREYVMTKVVLPQKPVRVFKMTKEEWLSYGLKMGWFGQGTQLPRQTTKDLQKIREEITDQQDLETLLNWISKNAKISPAKLSIVLAGIKEFWKLTTSNNKKYLIKQTKERKNPGFLFEALDQGDNTDTIVHMLDFWMSIPYEVQLDWKSQTTPKKTGEFLVLHYKMSKTPIIPTKKPEPEKTPGRRPAPKKDTRPLEMQAQEWDESKISREMIKRRFPLATGPQQEKDPQKRATIIKEIELLEAILNEKQKQSKK